MEKTGITEFLLKHAEKEPISFHVPGHKGSRLYREYGYGEILAAMADCDLTEIPGADNLFQPRDIIRRTMDKYKALYKSRESFLLVNGSSAGILAAVMTCARQGDSVIVARNCHKSVHNGLSLAGARPVYAYPELIADWGISGEITPEEIERCLRQNPKAKGVIVTSPNYYGVTSDIAAIAEIVHRAGKILIVDQAHGAHLPFFDRYRKGERGARAAENLGADIVINSTHKTLATFTQSAVANICSSRVDCGVFADKLQMVESSSPSYLLMASLDINADLLERRGEALICRWAKDIRWFYQEAAKIPGLRLLEHPLLDETKLNLDMSACGFDGAALEKALAERGVFAELTAGNVLLCMSGIGNRRCDYEALIAALKACAEEGAGSADKAAGERGAFDEEGERAGKGVKPQAAYTSGRKAHEPQAVPTETERIPVEQAAGRVSGTAITPYPPGIPLICPGEVMTEELLTYAETLRQSGETVMGIDDAGRVVAGKE